MRLPAPLMPAWGVLQDLAAQRANFDLPAAFAADAEREQRYTRSAAGLRLDLSRQCIDESVLAALTQLLDTVDMRGAIESMWRGEPINNTEQRAAWHVQLRRPAVMTGDLTRDMTRDLTRDVTSATAEVLAERRRMLAFADEIRASGAFDTVINIGIGGSDLGPAMVVQALRSLANGPKVYFVSNVDGIALHDLLQELDPARTLFIICSKTFTTQETLANAERARAWILEHLGESAIPNHFAAVSVNAAAMDRFGIAVDRRFAMWDWVGGRYSVWSAVGISLAMAVGSARFEEFLAGAHAMDEHFRTAPWADNLPALMALVGVWNINFLKIPTLAVLPYSERLARFPAFLQQLEMESNGKSVTREGQPVSWETAPVVWGEPGNNAQHSFFQLLHQGTLRAALDVILLRVSPIGDTKAQSLATANGLAQIETFAMGQQGADAHRRHPGSRPQSVLVLDELTPRALGALIALYEHKVFVQSVVWGINAFDQFGVEAGKRVCNEMLATSEGTPASASVRQLLKQLDWR
ncbi:MAG: glucose-6-phosphate isomerase [Gammaproteobacteria bacterium]|nr:glucose-6-phosphate isomerase [Gammaproteobacteria bacterium]